jgi:serine/threonine protein kinase
MPKLLTCPQGHQWEINDQANALTTDVRVRCPTCGAVVDLVTPDSAEQPATGTVAPSPGQVEPMAARIAPVPAPAAPPDLPGYEALAELGRGGMGVVYLARQTKLDRLVAVKVLPPETGADPAFAERFGREARALAKLNHPGIVTVHDFGQSDGHSYFIMEYVEGVNLRQRLRAGRIPLHDTLQLVGQICDALQYAHDKGIIHRDIKPENILIDQAGRVKIADFGLAKLLGRTAGVGLTHTGQVMGTLNYMAPEQLEKPLEVDHRADIYSLGVVLYEMLTGELPLGRFAPPSQKVGCDVRLDEIVLRALEKEPGRRYQRVGELKSGVTAIRSGPQATQPDTTSHVSTTGGVRTHTLLEARDTVKRLVQHGFFVGSGLVLLGIISVILTLTIPEDPFGTEKRRLGFFFWLGFDGFLILLGLPLVVLGAKVRQRWSAIYKGHRIRFENGQISGGTLVIDEDIAAEGGSGHHTELRATIHEGNGLDDQIVAIAEAGWFNFRCRIVAEEAESERGSGSGGRYASDRNVTPARAEPAPMPLNQENRGPDEGTEILSSGKKAATRRDRPSRVVPPPVTGPGIGLLLTGILQCTAAIVIAFTFGSYEAGDPFSWAFPASSADWQSGVPASLFHLRPLLGQVGPPETPRFSSRFVFKLSWVTMGTLTGIIMILGGLAMMNVQSYTLAKTSGVIALIPVTPAWLLGLPTGIWALAMLSRPHVKAAFTHDKLK